jgi:hypothetical protein
MIVVLSASSLESRDDSVLWDYVCVGAHMNPPPCFLEHNSVMQMWEELKRRAWRRAHLIAESGRNECLSIRRT